MPCEDTEARGPVLGDCLPPHHIHIRLRGQLVVLDEGDHIRAERRHVVVMQPRVCDDHVARVEETGQVQALERVADVGVHPRRRHAKVVRLVALNVRSARRQAYWPRDAHLLRKRHAFDSDGSDVGHVFVEGHVAGFDAAQGARPLARTPSWCPRRLVPPREHGVVAHGAIWCLHHRLNRLAYIHRSGISNHDDDAAREQRAPQVADSRAKARVGLPCGRQLHLPLPLFHGLPCHHRWLRGTHCYTQ